MKPNHQSVTWANHIRNFCHHTIDPRHVEAYMRLKFGTLDGLSRQQFLEEVIEAERDILTARKIDADMPEQLAQSYGL